MKKKFWKKYWSLFAVEGCVLVLFFLLAQFSYKKEFELQSKEIAKYTTKISEMDSFCDASSFCSHLNKILTMDGELEHYGFSATIDYISGSHPTYYKTSKRNWLIEIYNNPDKEKLQTIQFDSYFPEEELEKLVDFCQVDRNEVIEDVWLSTFHGVRDIDVRRMLGYYDEEEQFIPVEIEFYDLNNEMDTYTILNEEAKGKMPKGKASELFQESGNHKEKIGDEYFNIYCSINRMSEELRKEAEQVLCELKSSAIEKTKYSSSRERIVVEGPVELGESEEKYYKYFVSLCVDVKAEVLEEEEWKKELLWIFTTLQLLTLSIWGVNYVYKRRSEKIEFMKITFLNAMAHEMKTPTAVIKNSAECIREGVHPEKHDHYLEIIDKESEHMSYLLNSMLTYTRLTNAEYQIQRTKVKVTKIAEEICARNQDMMGNKKIKLEFNTIREFELEGDWRLLEMVVDNFISNAIRHCERGGEIRITSKVNGIWIYNTGNHISEEQIKHIWDPMYQGDSARAGESKSSGMGLAISDEILRLHHVRYGVVNVIGGVEFYFLNDRC